MSLYVKALVEEKVKITKIAINDGRGQQPWKYNFSCKMQQSPPLCNSSCTTSPMKTDKRALFLYCPCLNSKIVCVWPTVLELAAGSISPAAERLVWWPGHWWGHLGGTHHHSNSLAGAWPQSWWGCCSAKAGSPLNGFASPADTGQTHPQTKVEG